METTSETDTLPEGGQELLALVGGYFHLHPEEMTAPSRCNGMARQVVAYLLREWSWSYPQIGRLLQRRHPTVVWQVETLTARLEMGDHYAVRVVGEIRDLMAEKGVDA